MGGPRDDGASAEDKAHHEGRKVSRAHIARRFSPGKGPGSSYGTCVGCNTEQPVGMSGRCHDCGTEDSGTDK
jgi:hypothetical protein